MLESANLIHIMNFSPKQALPSLAGSRKTKHHLMSDLSSEMGNNFGLNLEGLDAAVRRVSLNMQNNRFML